MIALPQHSKVLIVGAGPSGLMMAAQLLRYGIQPLIIDIRKGPTNQSKALAVQARSLEIYRQLGVVDKVLSGGKQAGGVGFNQGGKQLASLNWKTIPNAQTLYPFVFLYPQSKNERVLLDYLTQACCPVYWETSLSSLKQIFGGVEVTLITGETTSTLVCDWVVGADGAHSVVRKQAGISFSGDTYQHKFYLADVKLADEVADWDKVNLFVAQKGFAGFFPMPDEHSFRIVGSLPDGLENTENIVLEDVLHDLRNITGSAMEIEKQNWFTTYKLHHRMADKFMEGRCFLIGDAAHIHSPVGGQGMNTGLQDAYNLAWKLAGVVNGQLKETVLNSYAAERMPVAKELLNTTDRVFNLITSRSWFSGILKRFVVPKALNLFWNSDKLRALFFKRLSQTAIGYRESKINLHLSHSHKIKAGDRLPYLEIYDEKKKEKTDIHTWCAKPGFTLITLGEISETYLFTIAKWITQSYQGSLNFFHLPSSASNQNVFDCFEVKPSTRKALIIRPDMYIGYMNDLVDVELMNNYLQNVAGLIKQG